MNNDQLSITDESFVSPIPPLRERFVSNSPGNLFQTSTQFFPHLGVFFIKVKQKTHIKAFIKTKILRPVVTWKTPHAEFAEF